MAAVPISGVGASSQTRYPQGVVPYAGAPTLPAPGKAAPQVPVAHLLIAGALVAGGALLLTGRRRAGLAAAAAGTALALFEEQETVAAWWKRLPEYLDNAQNFLDRVERYVDEAAVQGRRVQAILRR